MSEVYYNPETDDKKPTWLKVLIGVAIIAFVILVIKAI